MVRVENIPLNKIRRPLPRQNDQTKVAALMASIQEIGLQEPIDVLVNTMVFQAVIDMKPVLA